MSTASEGIEVRHSTHCATRKRRACDCRPSVRGRVMVDGTAVRKSFNGRGLGDTADRVNAARAWKLDAEKMIRAGTFRGASGHTIRGLMEQFLTGAETGTIKTRNGRPYAPSTLHRMRQAAECRVIPQWGDRDPDTLTSDMLERFVEDLSEQGLSASSVQNAVKPLSAMYRWALRTRRVRVNPTVGVLLPTGGERRERIATPDEAARLLTALPDSDRVLWALAFYGGLRRSEVLGLQWPHVDMRARTMRVRKSYHQETGKVRDIGKSKAAQRTLPMPAPLVTELRAHQLRTGDRTGYVIGGTTPGVPHWTLFLRRAYNTWDDAGLEKLCFHEARHTYASWIIAAATRSGEFVDWKELAGLMGHASVAMTIDLYGHLMPDHVDRAGRRLDKFLTDYGTDPTHADSV